MAIEAGNQPYIGGLLFDFESCDSSVDGKLLYIYFLLASERDVTVFCLYLCVHIRVYKRSCLFFTNRDMYSDIDAELFSRHLPDAE